MALTPEEIAGKEFGLGLRGYDQDEVRAFLRLVAAQPGLAASTDAGVTPGAVDRPEAEVGVEAEVEVGTAESTAEVGAAESTMSAEPMDGAAEAAALLENAHTEASRLRTEAEADAEHIRTRAAAVLAAAQDEALRLVADTHARVEHRFQAGNGAGSSRGSSATVDELGAQIRTLIEVRDTTVEQVLELRRRLDSAIAETDAGRVPTATRGTRT